MVFFNMLFGKKKITTMEKHDAETSTDNLRKEIKSEITRENDILRNDLAVEIRKMQDKIDVNASVNREQADKIDRLEKTIVELNKKFEDLSIAGRLSIENMERLDKFRHNMTTKEEIMALRHEILNVSRATKTENKEHREKIIPNEPKAPLAHILEQIPKSRRALVNILLHAETPITYKQIANKMGLTYNTIKVYVRDIRESGFPIEEFIAHNKKLLNIPNSVKATLIYSE